MKYSFIVLIACLSLVITSCFNNVILNVYNKSGYINHVNDYVDKVYSIDDNAYLFTKNPKNDIDVLRNYIFIEEYVYNNGNDYKHIDKIISLRKSLFSSINNNDCGLFTIILDCNNFNEYSSYVSESYYDSVNYLKYSIDNYKVCDKYTFVSILIFGLYLFIFIILKLNNIHMFKKKNINKEHVFDYVKSIDVTKSDDILK